MKQPQFMEQNMVFNLWITSYWFEDETLGILALR